MAESHPQSNPSRLELRHVSKCFRGRGGEPVWAALDVDLRLDEGERVAIVGESGSGKTTLGRLVTALEQPTRGEVLLGGVPVRRRRSLAAQIQMIFQDPFASFNPSHSIGYSIRRPVEVLHHLSPRAAWARSADELERVGLHPAASFRDVAAAQVSGGQRQRASIARAMALGASMLVADEPTSMLDVSVGAGILNLLLDLSRDKKLGLLFITHNLAAARYVAERIVVLYRGQVVEEGPADVVINAPKHPYTEQLVAAAPDPGKRLGPGTEVNVPGDGVEDGWCRFASRCPHRGDDCRAPIALREVEAGHWARCIRPLTAVERTP